MKQAVCIDAISDGKRYDINDMVKIDTGGCPGCSACCHGVGELVELTPFDAWAMMKNLDMTFDQLLTDKLELRLEDRLMLPYLKMHGEAQRCCFLGVDDRCTIHPFRPNICRLFPLGRVYEDGDFRYFLQTGACPLRSVSKIKVKKWIGIESYKENKQFLLDWYGVMKALSFRLKFVRDPEELSRYQETLLDTFYRTDWYRGDFYAAFYNVLPDAKNRLGIL